MEGKMNILVVDDMEVNRLLIKEIVTDMSESVDSAENGLEAIEMCREKKYDIVFMDISMPVLDGITAMMTIKSENKYTSHIVAFSAEVDEDDYHLYGFDGYIGKPFNVKDIIRLINAYKSDDR